jgi:DNA (cytosine-5)-methyltransferase 1
MSWPPAKPSVSLFSGAGGLDLGLERAGVRFAAWVEIDKDSQETLRRNFRVAECNLFSDITTVQPARLLAAAGVERGDAFLVAGGPPCQAFSTAGHRLSINDPRGALVERYFEVVESVMPRFFVFENVRGLLSAALSHRPLARRGSGHGLMRADEELGSLFRRVILPRFQSLGYEVAAGLVDAADYGVPQRRTRVIVLGSRDGEFKSDDFQVVFGRPMELSDLMPPTHSGPPSLKKSRLIASAPGQRPRPWETLRSAFQTVPQEPPEFIPYSPSRVRVFEMIPPGRNWRYIRDNPSLFTEGFLTKAMGGALSSTGGRVGFWRRLSYDEPSPTLTTSPVQLATGLCHPEGIRPLSVQEYKRLQDFPPTYFLEGTTASKYRQLGNAVPVGLGEAIGEALARTAAGEPWRHGPSGITSCTQPRLGDTLALV